MFLSHQKETKEAVPDSPSKAVPNSTQNQTKRPASNGSQGAPPPRRTSGPASNPNTNSPSNTVPSAGRGPSSNSQPSGGPTRSASPPATGGPSTGPQSSTGQKGTYAGKSKGRKYKPKTKESMKRQSMLNTHKIAPFKYDMNEILNNSSMDSSVASSFLATVIAKSSRVSTRDAKEFVRGHLDKGDLTKEEYDRVCRLMDKYSKYR